MAFMFNVNKIKTETIDTPKQISDLVDWLVFRHDGKKHYSPTMYIDLEGTDLCREGHISIFTLLIDVQSATRRVCLIDVHTLGERAFDTAGTRLTSLKDILQNEKIPKVFFDVRNDSDALFAHFGVALQGVEDVQLMESATRKTTSSRKLLNGLTKCIESNLIPMGHDLATWKLAKQKGEQLFRPENGGSYEVFNQRPLVDDLIAYCIGDVQCLPELRDKFWSHRAFVWQELVIEESKKRVAESQKPGYQPYGKDRALASWSAEQNRILDEWNYVPPSRDYEEDWFDDSPTSCRDIISSWDYDLYYSD